jgi:hypothetical protein
VGGQACKAKVILNGAAVGGLAESLCYLVDETEYDALTDEQWTAVIKHLNTAEDAMLKAQRSFLEALGFNGPWPTSMRS